MKIKIYLKSGYLVEFNIYTQLDNADNWSLLMLKIANTDVVFVLLSTTSSSVYVGYTKSLNVRLPELFNNNAKSCGSLVSDAEEGLGTIVLWVWVISPEYKPELSEQDRIKTGKLEILKIFPNNINLYKGSSKRRNNGRWYELTDVSTHKKYKVKGIEKLTKIIDCSRQKIWAVMSSKKKTYNNWKVKIWKNQRNKY